MSTNERPFFLSKATLDTVNSVSWFAMDASWMLESTPLSCAMIVPTVLSALCLCYIEKRRTVTLINLAILSWICMNVSWMFSELFDGGPYFTAAKSFFTLGVALVALAVASSPNISETFSHFRRFRLRNLK